MPSVPMPKAARAAIIVAFLIAILCALNLRSGPIMLLGVCLTALISAVGMLQRKAWSAYGMSFLLVLSILAMLFFAVTGQSSANFFQALIAIVLYGGLAALFLLAGHMLTITGANRGTPVPWILIAALFSLPFAFFRQITVPSNAMEDAFLPGDFLLIDRAAINPALGDVVAFHFPLDTNQILVRRILALPGDHVHFTNGTLFRNNSPISEPYVTHPEPTQTTPDVVVPANECYVLGDARANSLDSRQWGFVNFKQIIGKPKFIYDSLAPQPEDITPADGKFGDKFLVRPGPLLRRWDRVFKPL